MPPESEKPTAARAPARVLCVGGGRGGVGKSLLAVNLAVYLAQIGRTVVIADVDPVGADLRTSLGLDPSEPPPDEDAEPLKTPVPGLSLLPASFDPSASTVLRSGKKGHLLARLRTLAADYVVLDVGPGTAPATLDTFLAADVGVLVTVPEPPSVEACYRFFRAMFLRRLRRAVVKERFQVRLVERATRDLPPLAPPPSVIDAIAKFDPAIARLAATELARMHPRLVVNQLRLRSDLELGASMRAMAARWIGADVDHLGNVEYDDAVWLAVRNRRPLLIDSPTSKSARNLERIARRVLALLVASDAQADAASPALRPPASHYETLGVTRAASDEEIRRASKRQREVYAAGSLALTSLLRPEELAREQARIEEAHETLLDPVRRRTYDLSTFPDDDQVAPPPRRAADAAAAAELEMLQAELARELGPDTEFGGALLRKVREAQGVEIAELAQRTKISAMHFRAIEDEAYADLPALVYTRGFLQVLARALKLDPLQVSRTYLRRMREALEASGRPLA